MDGDDEGQMRQSKIISEKHVMEERGVAAIIYYY